ncbi:MAG TPA: hypothetical protein VJ124_18200 [Pyrinomonadaceae bacterium]|nr:hypothetical protein [Pyrinomonadaceae bacterium]
MNDLDIVSMLPLLFVVVFLLIILLIVLNRIFVNVGAREIAIKERRYLGAKMPPGRVVATEGEVGIQADVLKPGLHLIKFPFERVVRKVALIEIGPDEMGIVEAVDGEPMPPGRIFAPDRAQNAHNNFQDPIAFIKQGGVKGIQLRTLPPGLWPIHPYLFRVSIAKTTVIPQGKVGIIMAADGGPLDPGRLLGKAIGGHRNFQDAELFISSGGQKGPQVDILTPGVYRILTQSTAIDGGSDVKPGLFTVRLYDASVINENEIGLVEALDGAPLNPRDYVAESVEGHDNFQDGHEFIGRGGQRGPQKDILLPGTYYINPLLFKVIPETAKEVKPGEVAVIVSNVGKDPSDEVRRQMAAKVRQRMEREEREQAEHSAERLDRIDDKRTADEIRADLMSGDPADLRLDEGAHEAYVVPEGYRGIQETVVGPGRYYVNTLAIMFNAQREAEEKRIQLEKTKSQADNQKDLMAATVGVEIAGKRAEQRKAEAEGEAHYILQTGKAEAEKVRLMGGAQGVAYHEQVNALGAQGVALVETLKVIGEKGVRITPDVLASGGTGDGAGSIGTLLLLNLFRERLNLPAENGKGLRSNRKVKPRNLPAS